MWLPSNGRQHQSIGTCINSSWKVSDVGNIITPNASGEKDKIQHGITTFKGFLTTSIKCILGNTWIISDGRKHIGEILSGPVHDCGMANSEGTCPYPCPSPGHPLDMAHTRVSVGHFCHHGSNSHHLYLPHLPVDLLASLLIQIQLNTISFICPQQILLYRYRKS